MSRFPRGFSFQVNAGAYGGIYVNFTRMSWRIALGWVAITLFFFDIEPVFADALKRSNSARRRGDA